MNEIYVTGHRNPDTDSIVAAMSYAALKNALGEKEYVAVHLGTISDETNRMLERFHFKPPRCIQNVRTQVQDLDFDRPPCLDASVTMDRAWKLMRDQKISAIPVVNEDGTLYGMLSAGDIATFSLNTVGDPKVEEIPLFNLLSVIEGRIMGDGGELVDSVSGTVSIALPQNCENLLFDSADSIVLCGSQPDMIRRALDRQVDCLILCQTDVEPEWLENAGKTCVISTPLDASRVHRLIYQATPISRPCATDDLISFHMDDYIDDVREVVLKSRYRCYPVLDAEEKVVGTLSRYHLLKPRRKQVVLVDHNELAQTVPGPIALNTAVFIGYKSRGYAGAVATTLGIIVPSFVIILVIALLFADVRHNPVVDAAFKGMRPAVVALIIGPVISLARGMHWSMLFVIAGTALAVWYLGWSPIYILLAAALTGIGWVLYTSEKAKKQNDR